MGAIDEILANLPLDQLADQLGTDSATAEEAVRLALPSLFGGLQANVADEAGSLSLAEALTQHAENGLLDGGVSLDAVDTADGDKIVQHIFGAPAEQVQPLAGGLVGTLAQKLLPILAPIVMSYIANKLGMGSATRRTSPDSGGLGDLLGPILGGILGSALGGGSPQGQAGGGDVFSDILGQILGGGGGGGGAAPQAPGQAGGITADSPFQPYPGAPDSGLQMPAGEPAAEQQGGDVVTDILGQIFGKR